ncbi:SDR family NAD(P)-dependent oxidoreductase [Pararhodonellum marinum]|uniref:SDR family NAD(P)-dependent oxidoreductase n=1 Tax=Pararhodonellum marinum TaxID=2755358 RepID=UPI00188F37EA|nr:SDR family NAD(P)-dependent oxidoreductase [Pararhodonellum marinum]
MKDKICLITGANSGIGFETAKNLCAQGAKVLLWCRTEEKARQAEARIKTSHPQARTAQVMADLSSQKAIKEAAKRILHQHSKIDVLINNAGSWFSDLGLTEEGFERQWAINHLAPFLLTHLLLPALRNAPDARVITVSSDAHFHGKIHFEDPNLSKNYHGLRAYAQSKLANVLFTQEFDRRKRNLPISSYAVQPGLVKTDIGLKHTISFHGLMWKLRRLGGISPEKGAETSVFLASSLNVRGISGKYWDKCAPKTPSKKTENRKDAARLWELSMDMCGITNYFEP